MAMLVYQRVILNHHYHLFNVYTSTSNFYIFGCSLIGIMMVNGSLF